MKNEWKIEITGTSANVFTAQKYIPLQQLELSHNCLQKISFVTELSSLQCLNLSFNILTSITGLSNIKFLTKLNVSHNKLASLPCEFNNLQMLQELDAEENCIEKYDSFDQ